MFVFLVSWQVACLYISYWAAMSPMFDPSSSFKRLNLHKISVIPVLLPKGLDRTSDHTHFVLWVADIKNSVIIS